MDKYTEARDLVISRGPNLGAPDLALALVEGMVPDVDLRINGYVDDVRALVNAGANEQAILAVTALLLAGTIPPEVMAILFTQMLIRETRTLAII